MSRDVGIFELITRVGENERRKKGKQQTMEGKMGIVSCVNNECPGPLLLYVAQMDVQPRNRDV